jgi:hypothetical protein
VTTSGVQSFCYTEQSESLINDVEFPSSFETNAPNIIGTGVPPSLNQRAAITVVDLLAECRFRVMVVFPECGF